MGRVRVTTVTVVLTCGHELLFRYHPPKPGRNVYCTRCSDMRRVTGGPGDWRAVCDDCTFRRSRRRLETVRDNIADHLQKAPRHTVTLWQIGTGQSYKVHQQQPTTATGQDGAPVLGGCDSPDTLF